MGERILNPDLNASVVANGNIVNNTIQIGKLDTADASPIGVGGDTLPLQAGHPTPTIYTAITGGITTQQYKTYIFPTTGGPNTYLITTPPGIITASALVCFNGEVLTPGTSITYDYYYPDAEHITLNWVPETNGILLIFAIPHS